MQYTNPLIIQGGMGAGVSNWVLARAVSCEGHLGVVSGTALDSIFARRLQLGDIGGHVRRAMSHFPIKEIAGRILDRYFRPEGTPPGMPFKLIPTYSKQPPLALLEMAVCANFCEVFLAKEGHRGLVGINYLEKIQMPTLPSLYGAMLAGVDFVLMGAGIPVQIPGILDTLAQHKTVSMRMHVDGSTPEDDFKMTFQPERIVPNPSKPLKRPRFLGIVSSATLAQMLATKSTGRVDGFVVEGPTAGGHNAPPRGKVELNERGEPIYGARDEVDFDKMCQIGLPFWVAGSFGRPGGLEKARSLGAQGIQVGTAFALCRESGMDPDIKESLLQQALSGELDVFTDPLASPSGFPFKVAALPGTVSQDDVYTARRRVCDLGYLCTAYRKDDGTVGYRCPSEPVEQYLLKGGAIEDTVGRKCLCNALMANIGLPQQQKTGDVELPLVTLGDDVSFVHDLAENGPYGACDVIHYLTAGGAPAEAAVSAASRAAPVSEH